MPVAFAEIGALIARDPSLRGGRPIIAGTGVSVRTIAIENNRGLSPEEIAADRPPLSLAQIYAGLAFYHANEDSAQYRLIAALWSHTIDVTTFLDSGMKARDDESQLTVASAQERIL